MSDQKTEIIATRTGGLGSSDAKMVKSIGRNQTISEAQKIRLAVMLGLEQQKQFSTGATDYGNYIEQKVFETLAKEYNHATSNPFTKHEKYSQQYGFDIFNHIDFEVENENHLIWFECKAVNDDLETTLQKYAEQLAWHRMIGNAKASRLNKDFQLYLVHYQTADKTSNFEPDNITISLTDEVNDYSYFTKGFEIISEAIKDFQYTKSEELSSYSLPEKYQTKLDDIYLYMKDIERKTAEIEEFKAKMREIMKANNVKSIDNDLFRITTVEQSESIGFDAKLLEKEQNEIYKKYLTKKSVRKSYLKLTIK